MYWTMLVWFCSDWCFYVLYTFSVTHFTCPLTWRPASRSHITPCLHRIRKFDFGCWVTHIWQLMCFPWCRLMFKLNGAVCVVTHNIFYNMKIISPCDSLALQSPGSPWKLQIFSRMTEGRGKLPLWRVLFGPWVSVVWVNKLEQVTDAAVWVYQVCPSLCCFKVA